MTDIRVVIIVETGFVATELALVLDILRIANRLSSTACFDVKICTSSMDGLVDCLGGDMAVRAEPFWSYQETPPNFVVVLGGSGVCQSLGKIHSKLRWLERIGAQILLLSDAAYIWRKINSNDGAFTTHWENQQLLRDSLVDLDEIPILYVKNGRVTTGAGMVATADLVLTEIVAPVSSQLAQATSQMLVMDGVRDGNTPQPRSENDTHFYRAAQLDAVIRHMEENVETPVSMSELASVAGRSVRQLERRFEKATGCSPLTFYRSLRLRRSKIMLEQSAASIAEIAIACGFNSSSNFARMFSREFGTSPRCLRQRVAGDADRPSKSTHEKGSSNAPVTLSAPSFGTSSYASGTNGAPV